MNELKDIRANAKKKATRLYEIALFIFLIPQNNSQRKYI